MQEKWFSEYIELVNANKLDPRMRLTLTIRISFSFNTEVSLVLYIKKGTALIIPYSGEPERPRRSNYPLNDGFVSPKTLVNKCESAAFISLLIYIIHDFQKKYTGNIYKLFFLNKGAVF